MDIRRRFTYDYNSNFGDDSCPTNEIWYTSSNNNVVTPYKTDVFGATIKSNTYSNGKGVITFDGDVTSIGSYAFYACDLTSVTIPDSVTTIGEMAFCACALTSVYCKATTPPTGDSSMFFRSTLLSKIYVPMESVEAYKTASGWSAYAYAIVGYDFEDGGE